MKSIAVLFAPGFEESEGLTIVDVLRRAQLPAVSVAVPESPVTGAHGISLKADALLADVDPEKVGMVVIPGGYDGVDALLGCEAALELVRAVDRQGGWLAAICAGPRVLDRAGVLAGKRYACYPGQEEQIASGMRCEGLVVRDGNVITAPGPATVYAFAYALVDALGGDSLAVKNRMVYFNAFDEAAALRLETAEPPRATGAGRRVAVLMKEGFEEGETFSIVDILRRLGFACETYGFADDLWIKGMHGMVLRADKRFPDDIETCDAVVLPGGRPGGENLRQDPEVLDLLRRWNGQPGKYLTALCSGTTVLAAAGVIAGKRMTGYTGYAEKLPGAEFVEEVAVADANLVTSQGPATGYPFAFKLAETLGADTREARARLLYAYAGGKG